MRRTVRLILFVAAVALGATAARAQPTFEAFLATLRTEALAAGVSPAVFDRETRNLSPDLTLPDLVLPGRPPPDQRGQAEFTTLPADYLSERALGGLVTRGQELARRHAALLRQVEARTSIPGPILVAIWGRETGFSAVRGQHDALRALATQAFTGRRAERFRGEVIAALRLIQSGVPRADMVSSWAGAIGPMQMLPSEILRHGIDMDGDGIVDPVRSLADALASAGRRIASEGWRGGRRWATEVRPPANVDCSMAIPEERATVRAWLQRGFRPAAGEIPPADLDEPASLLLPAGTHGPAFLITANYFALKAYNFSDLYVLFVGHAADRIAGGGRFVVPWGRIEQPSTRDIEAMQRRLAALGLYRDRVDGRAGMATRAALGAYQKRHGLTLDCWPSRAVLEHLARQVP